jgi:glycosyltransferase involved in cell wall biosynthesis
MLRTERAQLKLRALTIAHSASRGGAEYCLDTTLRQLDRAACEATVVFPFEGPMAGAAREYGYDVRIAPLSHWLYFQKNAWYWKNLLGRSWANVLRLRKMIHEVGADVVYTNTSAIFESALAARLAGVPHVWHVHEVLADGNQMQQLLPLPVMKRLIYRLSNRMVFESHAARRVFETSTPGDKSEVVYNSLRLAPGGPHDRERFGFCPDDFVLGFVGQFNDRKNPLALIRALAKAACLPRLRCLFAGEGPLEAAMRTEVARLGLAEHCRIIGFQADVAPLMQAIDVLVLPSRQESFGLVLVEAASLGKPAIACRCEGPSEIVVDGQTGLLVPQDDVEHLARAIERMFADDGCRARMGEAARRRANEEFCPVKNTRKLERLLAEVIEESRRKRRGKRGPLIPEGKSLDSSIVRQAGGPPPAEHAGYKEHAGCDKGDGTGVPATLTGAVAR